MNVFWIIITLLVMTAGLLGTVIPVLPGIPLIYASFLFYGVVSGWKFYGAGAMIVWGIITVMLIFLDFYTGSIGAQKYGGSKFGIWGAFIGGILGVIFFNFPGLIAGPFVGAVAGELIAGRTREEAFKSGWGTLVGFLAGGLFKIAVGIIMIGTFLWWVLF
jgi:uncharacterized protein YqgC (DUF456 family)